MWTLGGALGAQTLTASASGLSSVGFTASGTPGRPKQVAIITQPSTAAVNGVAFATQPGVELRDFYGNPTLDDGVTITAALATDPGGTLGGTRTSNTVDGKAPFVNLKITGVTGNYAVKFTSPNLSSGTSGQVALAAGAPSALALRTQPSAGATSGDPFSRQPVVEVKDAGGNLLDGSEVTATIQSEGERCRERRSSPARMVSPPSPIWPSAARAESGRSASPRGARVSPRARSR